MVFQAGGAGQPPGDGGGGGGAFAAHLRLLGRAPEPRRLPQELPPPHNPQVIMMTIMSPQLMFADEGRTYKL